MSERPLPLPVVAVSGSPAECGAAYGASAAALIAENNAAYLRRFTVRAGLTPDQVRRQGALFRATTRDYHPAIADMLDGMAEGSGVAVDEIYALNGRTELLYGTSAPVTECTSLGVIGERTMLGQNWDWHPQQRPYTLLLSTTDEAGFTITVLAEAGMLAKAGLNSAGVGVCVNMLGTERDGRPGGVPYHVLLRAVLEADSLGIALRQVCKSPRGASINLLIGQAYEGPGGGEILDVELVPGEVGFLHPDASGRIAHANHLETSLGVRDTLLDWGGSSFFRAARARRLLAAGWSMAEVLVDHAGFPHAICRHLDKRDAEDDWSETIFAVLIDLDARRIGIAPGPPCGSEFTWITQAEAAAVAALSASPRSL
jgi:isopenicillin-N N-acyltransferase like protein